MKIVKTSCPACGGRLEVADNLASANCPHCGSKIILDWEGKTSLAVHLELGKTFLRAGNSREADQHFSSALEKNPNSGEAWFWKGIVWLETNGGWETYLERSEFSAGEMVTALATTLSCSRLNQLLFSSTLFHGSHVYEIPQIDMESILLDAYMEKGCYQQINCRRVNYVSAFLVEV